MPTRPPAPGPVPPSRSPLFLLVANVLARLVIGGFAAFQLESFAAWVGGTVVATAPSVAALVAHWRTK